jgi:potassium channel
VDPQLILTIDDIANVFFFMDLFFNFLTAVKVDGVYISRRRDIAMHYMQSWFLVDLVSTVPIDQWFGNNLSGEASFNKLLRLLRVFKLFRVFRAARIMRRVEQILKFNPAIKRLGKLLSMVSYHHEVCSFYFFAFLSNSPCHVTISI